MSCSQYDDMSLIKKNNTSVHSYSGEDLFSGIFFKQGHIGKKIYEDTLFKFNVEEKHYEISNQEIIHFQAQLIKNIKNKHPDYFDEFKYTIVTRDLLKIENAVKKGGEMVYNLIEEMSKKDLWKKFEILNGRPLGNYISAERDCLMYLVAVFAVYVYAAAYMWRIGPNVLPEKMYENKFRIEKLVYAISQL